MPSELKRGRTLAAGIVTVLGLGVALFAVLAPVDPAALSVWSFFRIPVEPVVVVIVLLLLPVRAVRPVAAGFGFTLGVVAFVKALDLGLFTALGRSFHLAYDWQSLTPVIDLLTPQVGRPLAIATVIAVVLAAAALVVCCTIAAVRVSGFVRARRTPAMRTALALAVVWVVALVAGLPVAASSAAGFAYDQAREIAADLRDRAQFERAVADDQFADVPADELLTALRGKNVVLMFVESYGRVALQDREIGPQVRATLAEGTARLRSAGFGARSAFLTSPTVGGGSWLAHATLQTGVWVDNHLKHADLMDTDRFHLTAAFDRAGWRTVGVVPANTGPWPHRGFYDFDAYYDAEALGYRGPRYAMGGIPDQYTLEVFARRELARHGGPIMAEIDLISSHWPWDKVPRMVPWDELGDGSILRRTPATVSPPGGSRAGYADTIRYTLRTITSFIERYGDDKTVFIVVGDHQPASMITGGGPERDVPITVVTRDRDVLDRIAAWRWEPGMAPSPRAQVWRMDTFRDRFLTTFGRPPS